MKNYPTYIAKIKSTTPVTFGNQAGQTLSVTPSDLIYMKARKSLANIQPESDPNNWLVDVYSNGQHIVLTPKSPVYNGD